MPHGDVDVIVLGGGPAGSSTATLLARKGWRVTLLERERFPRPHVGESLLSGSMPLLRELGVADSLEAAGFLKKYGATMVWGTQATPWSWYFGEVDKENPHSYQVSRPEFDQILLRNARNNGVDVRERHRATGIELEASKGATVVFDDDQGRHRKLLADFIVDATGQTGMIARKQKLRIDDPFFQNLGVYAYFEGGKRLDAPNENNILVESVTDGWIWLIPLHDDRSSVGVVTDSRRGQKAIRELGLDAFFQASLDQSTYAAGLLDGATQISELEVVKDWSYMSRQLVGRRHVLVGDAGCFVDPLFSSGIHVALSGAVLASAYVTTSLKRPEMQEAAGEAYERQYRQHYHHFREMAKLFYASNRTKESYFWETRRQLAATASEATSREAFVHAVAGQPPKTYERVVLDHGDMAPFRAEIERQEGEIEARRSRFDTIAAGGTPEGAHLLGAIPRLASDVQLERRAVLSDGEFVWGDVLVTPQRPEGMPIGTLVREAIAWMDGRRTCGEIVGLVVEARQHPDPAHVASRLVDALRVLYTDGAIAELGGL